MAKAVVGWDEEIELGPDQVIVFSCKRRSKNPSVNRSIHETVNDEGVVVQRIGVDHGWLRPTLWHPACLAMGSANVRSRRGLHCRTRSHSIAELLRSGPIS